MKYIAAHSKDYVITIITLMKLKTIIDIVRIMSIIFKTIGFWDSLQSKLPKWLNVRILNSRISLEMMIITTWVLI